VCGNQVAHNATNAKYKKAKKLGIKTLEEDEYTELLNGKSITTQFSDENLDSAKLEGAFSSKAIVESFTKKEILSLLKKMKNTNYRSSWKKDKLVEQMSEYGTEEVLKHFTSNQLKAVLRKYGKSTSGNKKSLSERVHNILLQQGENKKSRTKKGEIRKYTIEFSSSELSPFSYWVNTISKDAYQFWKKVSENELNDGLDLFLRILLENSPRQLSVSKPLTISEVKNILKKLDKDTRSQLPKNIPDKAFIFPTGDSIYDFNNVRSGCVFYFDDDPSLVNIIVKQHTESKEKDIWSGALSDLGDAYKEKKCITKKGRSKEYFLDWFQSEEGFLLAELELQEPFDISKVQVITQIDPNSGLILNTKSVYYDEKLLDSTWEIYGCNPWPPSLVKGLVVFKEV